MALSAITTLDIPGGNQIIKFNNSSQLDEVDYSGGNIIFKAISLYNLSKSDFILWFGYLNVYNTALTLNFPIVQTQINDVLPACEIDYKIGSTRITYDQHSASIDVLNLTYLFSNQTMTFAARASDVTITVAEFLTMLDVLRLLTKQIILH